jgi:hypothetical protein
VLGQRAQCPFCKCHFQAPIFNAEGSLSEPRLHRASPFANRRVTPAIILLFASVLGAGQNLLQVGQASFDPQAYEEQTRQQLEKAKEQFDDPNQRNIVERTLTWRPRIQIASAVLSLVSLAGSIAMLRARRHGLAMLGSVVGMFNIANCCCFANILIGGWALSTLIKPDVRAEFEANRVRQQPVESN